MRFFRTFISALAVVALAACGGGSGGTLPSGTSGPGPRNPSGGSIVFEDATLWVAYGVQINAFATDFTSDGPLTPATSLPSFRWSSSIGAPVPGIVDIAVGPEGAQYVLENRSAAGGGPGWRLFTVAGGENQPYDVNGDDVNFPFAVGVAGDGLHVGYREPNGTATIATYPYGASNASPLYAFHSTAPVIGFAEGNDSLLYVLRPGRVDVYNPDSNGCCPRRSVATTGLSGHVGINSQEFAVGPDNSIYVTDLPGSNANPVMYVNVYAPGSGQLTRRVGPIPADYGGFGFPAIAVDAQNRLYVATTGKIYRFGPETQGADAPERVMTDSTQARTKALAFGPKL